MNIEKLRFVDFTASELNTLYKALVYAEMMSDAGFTDKFNVDELKQVQIKALEAKMFVDDREKVNLN